MKKLMKILPFISLGVVATSVLAVMLCYMYRRPLMELFFNTGMELPVVVPVANAVSLVGQLGAMIWLCICVGNRGFGIWAELLGVGWLAVVLPGLCRFLSWVETVTVGRALGSEYLMAGSHMNILWSYATIFNGVAVSIALVVCGMSMVSKQLSKNRE
jgi:hypothetical protein